MKKLTQAELEEAFVDVRKAYRLLYHYQRRVLDLVKFIGDNLGYDYNGGWSYFSHPAPRNGKGKLDFWSWDWLNMYFYEFHFGFKNVNGTNVGFSIFLQSDTGFFDVEMNGKTNIEDFAEVDQSKTRLIFIAGKNGWNPPQIIDDNKISSKVVNLKKELKDGGFMIGKAYDLSKFRDEESTLTQIEDFINYCTNEDIMLKTN